MKKLYRSLMKHLRIYAFFIKSSFMSQMEYRINFISSCMVECAWLVMKIVYVLVVFQTGVEINGLSPDAVLIFVGVYTMMTGLYCAFFFVNFYAIPMHIQNGTLDFYISKPVSLQFIMSLRAVDFGLLMPNLAGGLAMVIIGWSNLQIPVTFNYIAGFAGFMAAGLFTSYSIFQLPLLISFKTVKADGLKRIMDTLWDFNNMPMQIYTKWIQRLGTFVFPLFLISNISPLYILDRLSAWEMAWAWIAPVAFFIITRKVWHIAVRHYASASS